MSYHLLFVAYHYGYDAIVELFVDFSDQLITHYVLIIVIKAGVVHIGFKVFRRVATHGKSASSAPKEHD